MAIRLTTSGETLPIPVPDRLPDDRGLELEVTASRMTTATPEFWNNPEAHLTAVILLSRDGGTTWERNGAWGAYGGVHLRRDGTESAHSYARFEVPPGNGLIGKIAWDASAQIDTELYLTLWRTDALGHRQKTILQTW